MPLEVSEGDEVIYSKYGGTEVKLEGEDVLILSEHDILARVAATAKAPGQAEARRQEEVARPAAPCPHRPPTFGRRKEKRQRWQS